MIAYNFIRGNQLEAFLLRKVFKKGSSEDVSKGTVKQDIENIKGRKPFMLPPKCCNCRRTSKEKRILESGWNRVEKELEVDYIIRTHL